MLDIFYDFYGWNQKLFIVINSATNIGILPYFFGIISLLFGPIAAGIYYTIYCFHLRKSLHDPNNQNTIRQILQVLIKAELQPSSITYNGASNEGLAAQALKPPKHTAAIRDKYSTAIRIAMRYLVICATYWFIKLLAHMPRPFCSLQRGDFVSIIDIDTNTCFSSFPSTHTAIAVLIATCIWSHTQMLQKLCIVVIVLLVGISRITLAMHYPADIIYSILISTLLIKCTDIIFDILLAKNFIRLNAIQ